MLKDNITSLIAESLKNQNHTRTRTLRMIKAAFLEAEKAPKAGEWNETKEIQILQKMVKQREDARQQYIEANRIELAKNEYEEILIIQEFLPKPVSKEEILNTFNILTIPHIKQNMGQLIKEIKRIYPGADGKLVSDIVKENIE